MDKFLDDILIFAGCGLILIGTFQVMPVATWFVAGGLLVALGVMYGLGYGSKERRP
jgi:uncharacterized membrane protein SirB2